MIQRRANIFSFDPIWNSFKTTFFQWKSLATSVFFTIQLHTNGAHVSKCFIFQNNEQHLEDLIPVAYDVPKIRDSLSTIEEEHQEYDIPRNVNHALKNFDTDDSDPLVNNSEENLYENQAYQDKKEVSKKQTVCLCRFRINFKKWF